MAIFSSQIASNTVRYSMCLLLLILFMGRVSSMPCRCARQSCANGHWGHFGVPFGRQIIAPSSISAWLKSPTRSGNIAASAVPISFFTWLSAISLHDDVRRLRTLENVSVYSGSFMLESNGCNCAGCICPDTGSFCSCCGVAGSAPPYCSTIILAAFCIFLTRL